jgi:hypothetical protein
VLGEKSAARKVRLEDARNELGLDPFQDRLANAP